MNTPHGDVGGGIPFQAGCIETACSIISLLHQHLHASFPAREIGAAHSALGTLPGKALREGTQGLGPWVAGSGGQQGHEQHRGPAWAIAVGELHRGRLQLCRLAIQALWIPQDFLFFFFPSKCNPTYHHFQKNPQIQSPKCYPCPVNHLKILPHRKGCISSLSGPSFLTSPVPHSPPPTCSLPPPKKQGAPLGPTLA